MPEPLFSITAVFLPRKSRIIPSIPAYYTLLKGGTCVVPRAKQHAACASWLVAEWTPPPPVPPAGGGSPAHHPRRRSVRVALRLLPRRFAPTSQAPVYPHRPPSSRVECMMRGSVGVRWLAVRPFALYACSPCASRRHRRLRSLRPPTQPAFWCVQWVSGCALAGCAPVRSLRYRSVRSARPPSQRFEDAFNIIF